MTTEPVNQRYTAVAITLHWLIAAAIIGMIVLGWDMTDWIAHDDPNRFWLIQLHKSIGITILLLSVARVVWRLMNPPPPEPPMPALQAGLAKFVHAALYVMIIVMPLSGWIMVSASSLNKPTVLYWTVPWPYAPGLNDLSEATKQSLKDPLEFVHSKFAWVIIVLLGLHVAGALKHQFFDKDNLLARMWPGFFGRTAGPPAKSRGALWAFGAATAILAAGAGLGAMGERPSSAEPQKQQLAGPAAPSTAPSWTIDPAQSSIAFKTAYKGRPVQGSFKNWTAKIQFDPDKPEAARVMVAVKTASAATGEPFFDDSLKEGDWFNAAKSPDAVFEVNEGVLKSGPNQFEATGVLTIKGVAFPLRLPFTLQVEGAKAKMHAETTLKRMALGVGKATPAAEPADKTADWVADDVALVVDVSATRQ